MTLAGSGSREGSIGNDAGSRATRLSTAQQICQSIQGRRRPTEPQLDEALFGPPSELLKKLRKIRSGSVNITHGSFRSYAGSDGEGSIELCWQDRVLIWTQGYQLVRTFTFANPVMQAFWTQFEMQASDTIEVSPGTTRQIPEAKQLETALCVFFEQAIHIHLPASGEQIEMDLPFRFAKAFPAPVGFLIQRQVETEDERIATSMRRSARDSSRMSDASGMGYPFPDVNGSMEDSQMSSLSFQTQDPWNIQDEPGRILPIIFYLRRSFDDLVPVDRYPQLSSTISRSGEVTHMTHGPASPFTEVEESIVFVETGSDQFPHHIIVTADRRTSTLKIYAFAASPNRFDATSTLLSPNRAWSSTGKSSLPGLSSRIPVSDGVQFSGSVSTTQATTNAVPGGVDAIVGPFGSGAGHSLGKGLPHTIRRSARLEMERRSSGVTSTAMGRDPSGRSRRISALHAGSATSDRRAAARADDAASQGRDRTIGNISHTIDGLRLQGQPFSHEAMMEEFGPASTSMRVSTSQGTTARLRRSSQATRTPYNGPRNSNRPTSSVSRTRPSLTLSRMEGLPERGSQTPSVAGPGTTRLDAFRSEPEALGGSFSKEQEADLIEIADLDGFARSFACVTLLEEIKMQHPLSSDHIADIRVNTATFRDTDEEDAQFLFISIPGIDQTLCRRVGQEQVSTGGGQRSLFFSRPPGRTQGTATIDTSHVAPVKTLSPSSTEIVTIAPNGGLILHLGLPSTMTPKVEIGRWSSYSNSSVLSERRSSVTERRVQITGSSGHSLTVREEGADKTLDLALDFRPSCSKIRIVLDTLIQTLPRGLSVKIKAGYLKARFFSRRATAPEATVTSPSQRDREAMRSVLCRKSQQAQAAPNDPDKNSLAKSLAHRMYGVDELINGLLPMKEEEEARWVDDDVEAPVDDEEANRILHSLQLLAEDARLDGMGEGEVIPVLVELLAAMSKDRHVPSSFDLLPFTAKLPQLCLGPPDQAGVSSTEPVAKRVSDTYELLSHLLTGNVTAWDSSSLADFIGQKSNRAPLRRARKTFPALAAVLAVYADAHRDNPDPVSSVSSSPSPRASVRIVSKMLEVGLDLQRLRRLPIGVALPLFEALRDCQLEPPEGQSAAFYQAVQRSDLVLNQLSQRDHRTWVDAPQRIAQSITKTLPEGACLDPISAQLFHRDFRLTDVVKMLQTTQVNTVYVPEAENQTEADISEQHNTAVTAIGNRTKALPAGRGMLFMSSRTFSPTSKWRIAPICLVVRVQPRGVTIEPDTKAESTGLEWPEFHNGVASILELKSPAGLKIDSKWIFAHLEEQITARHAGFLLGLGLMKQLPSLTRVHVFRYLKLRNTLLTIGFLLGMAASVIGTADPTARHLIGMQLVAFLPAGSAPLNLSMITQTAGLLAMGLVFLGSNHRWTAKRLLDQIGAQESSSPHIQPQHREAYSLSAGLALGLVYLGKGRIEGMKSLPDKKITAHLVQLIQGRFDGIGVRSKGSADRKLLLDGELNLTSTPASIALGLIFLRSGRQDIADILAPPRTVRDLDFVRPDVLFSHVLARHLILWDSIAPTTDWLMGVLPVWMQKQLGDGESLAESAQLAHINMRAAACFAIGLKFAGSQDEKARDCLWQQLDRLSREIHVKQTSFFSKIRRVAVQAALDQVTVALSMVMAGSGNVDILRQLRRSHGDTESDTTYGTHMATHLALGLLFLGGGRFTLGTSDLAVAALTIAFFPPYPRSSSDNRAHLQAFRHLWILAVEPRLLVTTDIDTNEIACLPVKLDGLPLTLGQERKFTPLLLPRFEDIGTIKTATARYWPTQMDVTSSLPRIESAKTSLVLYVKRKTGHLSYSADPNGSRNIFSRALGTAAMDLDEGAADEIGPRVEDLQELVDSFTTSSKYKELIDGVCGALVGGKGEKREKLIQSRLQTMVMECLSLDKGYMLPVYVEVSAMLQRLEPWDSHFWIRNYADVKFADDFYEHHYERLYIRPGMERDKPAPLIQHGLLKAMRNFVQSKARSMFDEDPALQVAICRYLTRTGRLQDIAKEEGVQTKDLCLVLVASEVPDAEEMRKLAATMRSVIEKERQQSSGVAKRRGIAEAMKAISQMAFGDTKQAPWMHYTLDRIVDHLLE